MNSRDGRSGRRRPDESPPYRVPDLRSSALRAPAAEPLAVPVTPSELTGPGPVMSARWTAITDLTRSEDGGSGFGRSGIGADGCFRFDTLRPGRVALPDGSLQAPHVVLQVFGRGLLDQLTTRIYFPDEPANATDPILSRVPAERRPTLVTKRAADDGAVLRFDIVLQGPDETVFLDT